MVRCRVRSGVLVLVVALLAAVLGVPRAHAQQGCFPETGNCIGGRFAQFWSQNGGLAVFGYPLSNELSEGGRAAQYYERQRFELHPENQAPYDVLLGLLGVEVLRLRGVDWSSQPASPGPVAGCLWFGQTRHNVCNQTPGSGFLRYWSSNGLEFDGQPGKSYAESLALFGLPITEPYQDSVNGQSVQVQWFERARFEWHPANPEPYRVLLGRLGAEVRPTAPPQPQPQPAYASQSTPTDVLGSFYNAISRQEYPRAYGYWESPPTGYDQFVQGYADTAGVQVIVQPPTFIDAGAGNLRAAIPTVLVSSRRSGGQQSFAGCYVTRRSNIQPDVWHISQAQIAPVDAGASIPVLLAQGCAAFGVPAPSQTSYTNQSSPVDLLASFYNAISRQEYQRAYGYWESPPTGYDQFVQGYADTAGVQLIIQLPVYVDVGAGNANARVPTVLVSTSRGGAQQVFEGCYRTHRVNIQPDPWRIAGATIAPSAPGTAIPAALARACAG